MKQNRPNLSKTSKYHPQIKKKKQVKKKYTNTYKKTSKVVPKIKPKRRKIRYGRILLVFFIFCICFYFVSFLLKIKIQNIYIKGNEKLSDQEIIELANLQNYPSYAKTFRMELKRKLEQDPRIVSAKIQKKKWKVYIEIKENIPLFYNQTTKKTILFDFRETEELWNAPILLNYVPDTIYEQFKKKMKQIEPDILERVSEIMYQPNKVDEERFLFTMCDGNYVYLTLETLEIINHYVSIYAEFTSKHGNKKGILNLDSGQFFTILES